MASLRIPQEVYDKFIDSLYDDIGALASCALVSRAWLPRAHANLFSSITLTLSAHIQEPIHACLTPNLRHHLSSPMTLEDPPSGSPVLRTDGSLFHGPHGPLHKPSKLARLPTGWASLKILLAQNPRLGGYARRLTLRACDGSKLRSAWFLPDAGPSSTNRFRFSLFPAVRALTLSGFQLESFVDLLHPMRAFPLLECLSAEQIIATSTLPMAFLSAFNALPAAPELEHSEGPIPPLRALSLEMSGEVAMFASTHKDDGAAELARRLLDVRALEHITALHLRTATHCRSWLHMLPRLASTLVDLAVAVQQERLTYSSEFAPAACACSPYLLIRCTSDANLSSIDAAIESTYAALLPCRALRALTVYYDSVNPVERAFTMIPLPGHVDPFFLSALATLLSITPPPFPRLERLGLGIQCGANKLDKCHDACGALARALVGTSKDGPRRFPVFESVNVRVDEARAFPHPLAEFFGTPSSEKEEAVRDVFEVFEMLGVEVNVEATRSVIVSTV